jgi:hypothetical protein
MRAHGKQKNDFRDAQASAEAVRPTMEFVATKTADRLDVGHRCPRSLLALRK